MTDKTAIDLLQLPIADAVRQAHVIGRGMLADPSVFEAIWCELATRFSIRNLPEAPVGMDDDTFDAVVRVLTLEFRAGLQEAIEHVAEMEGGA